MVIALYRIARGCRSAGVPLLPRLIYLLNRVVFAVVLPPSAVLGSGVRLGYQGLGTVIHARAVIGDGVLIGNGVTIGGRSGHRDVPVIGDRVVIGAGAKLLGPIRVGAGAIVGANAVVIHDVPPGAVVAGVPARIVRQAKALPDGGTPAGP